MTMSPARTVPRRRAELTYKHNIARGRHGWLRLTPAYSVRLVDQVLAEFGRGVRTIFDPFSGTGTTALSAAYLGLDAGAVDVNPFLVWLGRVKSARYRRSDVAAARSVAKKIAMRVESGRARAAAAPRLRNIERWWAPAELDFLTRLRGEVSRLAEGPPRDLLEVAFCRTMIALSNAAFNHQSMSFKERGTPSLHASCPRQASQFLSDVSTVLEGADDNPRGKVRIEHADARDLAGVGACDLLVTSPPYPNRMSYIRELRPYMYWLGFLGEARQAGELDWTAIGGTWGIATSRLTAWRPSGAFVPSYLLSILERIRGAHPKNGKLMASYVHKYFDDMFRHFESAARVVRPGGSVHYIVGNSTFYGHVVPAETLYCDQLVRAGFRGAEARAIRKRNSKKELIEFHVMAER
jgi:hypothetical protein